MPPPTPCLGVLECLLPTEQHHLEFEEPSEQEAWLAGISPCSNMPWSGSWRISHVCDSGLALHFYMLKKYDNGEFLPTKTQLLQELCLPSGVGVGVLCTWRQNKPASLSCFCRNCDTMGRDVTAQPGSNWGHGTSVRSWTTNTRGVWVERKGSPHDSCRQSWGICSGLDNSQPS